MGTTRDKSDEEFSVIGDKGDIGFIDLENCRSACTYYPNSESDIVIISVPFPLVEGKKPQSVIVGETIVDSITIKNTTNGALNLWSVKIYDSKPEGSFTISLMEPPTSSSNLDYIQEFLESFSLEDRVLRPGQTLTVWLSCKPKEIGLHTSAVHFTVGDDNETIERIVFLLAEDRISQSLASKQPYNRCRKKKQMACNALAENSFVRGSHPAKASTRVFKRRIPLYPIPNDIRELVESKQIPDAVREGLTQENYASYFKNLLIMEEIKMEKDMRDHDMECVTMRSKGQFLTLEVPGLAERRPSLVHSDFILAKPVSEGVDDTGSAYQGIIHRVEAEEVYLKFDPEFHRRHRADNVYNVQFTYNRINMRRFYQAVEAAERLESGILFPSVLGKNRVIELTQLVPISCMLNEEQMNSIEMILGCRGGAPYVIHGPPGTGKTKTVVEAVLQLYRNFKNARILVCTPSNSAADHILERLLSENTVEVQDKEIFRLNALTRTCDDIKEDYIKFCFVEGSIFKCPDLSILKRYRIIISTYACASLLYSEGIKRGHFSHIFLDEAGQASEPETMVPLSTLCRRDTVVVLAGDPMQLGPVIFSQEAEMYGLGKSYLERLFDFNCYGTRNENYVTRLVQNYRCHPEILHLPSELFYNGELIACKNDEDITSMTWADILPNKEFPVLFLGIQGLDEREGSNPSWFNRIEASKVVEIINNLTGNMGLVEQDIGVITPYRQQVLKIRNTLERLGMFHIKVGSVEQFQGQERKVIIISTVRSTVKHNEFDRIHYLGFLSNPRRFNVAISRARSLLIVIGNPHIICKDTYWNKLLWRCSDNGSYQGCFLPEREDVPDEFTVANYGDYGAEDRLEPSETALCGQDSFPREWEQDSFPREWGQESYPREWDQESYRREWVQESFPTEEIPAPVLDEAEWSDGWK